MAVKIGKIPPRGRESKIVNDLAGQSSTLPGEHDERCRMMESIYGEKDPTWQDTQHGRDKEFSELFDALKKDGLFSKDNGKEKKRVYFPAANRQLETLTFSYHCRNDDSIAFIGGDIVRSQVPEGKKRLKPGDGGNADFVVADAFHVPFEDGSLDAIIDIAGATWYALAPCSPGKSSRGNLKSLLHEWHKALGPKGVVVLDDYSGKGSEYLTTMDWFRAACPDIFKNIKKDGLYFSVDDYGVAFKAKTVKVGGVRALSRPLGGRAYIFEKA